MQKAEICDLTRLERYPLKYRQVYFYVTCNDDDDDDMMKRLVMLMMLMLFCWWWCWQCWWWWQDDKNLPGSVFFPKGETNISIWVQFFSSFLSPPCGALTIFKWFSLSFQCILLSVNKNPVGPSQGHRMCIKTFTNLILEIYLWNWKFSHSISLAN